MQNTQSFAHASSSRSVNLAATSQTTPPDFQIGARRVPEGFEAERGRRRPPRGGGSRDPPERDSEACEGTAAGDLPRAADPALALEDQHAVLPHVLSRGASASPLVGALGTCNPRGPQNSHLAL